MPLNLRIRSTSTQHDIVLADSATLGDLLAAVSSAAAVPAGAFSLRTGFPPKELAVTDGSQSVRSAGIRSGDSLVLTVQRGAAEEAATAPAAALSQPPSSSAPSSSPELGRAVHRPQRAAKEAAGSKIREQLLQDEAQARAVNPTPPRRARPAAVAARKRPASWLASPGVRLGSASDSSSAAAAAVSSSNPAPGGASTAAAPAQKRRRVVNLGGSGGFTLEEKLVSAAAATGKSADSTVDFLRKSSKAALLNQYEVTRANSRLAAALAGRYEITPDPSSRTLATGTPTSLIVRYAPAAEGARASRASSWLEERVDNIPLGPLIAHIRSIFSRPGLGGAGGGPFAVAGGSGSVEGGPSATVEEEEDGEEEEMSFEAKRELLKPHLLAQISPRQFWALVRFGGALLRHRAGAAALASAAAAGASSLSSSSSSSSASAMAGGAPNPAPAGPPTGLLDLSAGVRPGCPVDPGLALRALLPDVDWDFLTQRARRLSEKATVAAAAKRKQGAKGRTSSSGSGSGSSSAPLDVVTIYDDDDDGDLGGQEAGPGAGGAPSSSAAASAAPAAGSKAAAAATAKSGPSVLLLQSLRLTAAALAAGTPVEGDALACLRAGGIMLLKGDSDHRSSSSSQSPFAAAPSSLVLRALRAVRSRAGLDQRSSLPASSVTAVADAAALEALAQALDARFPSLVTAFPGEEDGGSDDAEERTFECEACGRARIVSSRDGDLDAIEADPHWTCGSSGIGRLLARGGCDAPDDTVVRVLGSEAAAAACAAVGLPGLSEVAATEVADDSSVLYRGPEDCVGDGEDVESPAAAPSSKAAPAGASVNAWGREFLQREGLLQAFTALHTRELGALVTEQRRLAQAAVRSSLAQPSSSAAAAAAAPAAESSAISSAHSVDDADAGGRLRSCLLAQRIPPAAVILACLSPAAAAAAALGDSKALSGASRSSSGGAPVKPLSLQDSMAHGGYKLCLAAALVLLEAASGPDSVPSSSTSSSSSFSSSSSSSVSSPSLAAVFRSVVQSQSDRGREAVGLLRTPEGWVACARLAASWCSSARADVFDELRATILGEGKRGGAEGGAGGGGEPDDEEEEGEKEQYSAILERARVNTPQDLLSTPADVLQQLFLSPPGEESSSPPLRIPSLALIEAWRAAARRLVEGAPWMAGMKSC